MPETSTLEKLRSMGYARSEDCTAPIQRETTPRPELLPNQNYKGAILNHTIMERITLKDCNYDGACVTGSIFRNCKFINCSMDQADFEFCEFYHCEFIIKRKKILGCSFNNSSFIDSGFQGVCFDSCTFTGALFQSCLFNSAKICYSTLENAVFKRCSFYHMDLRYLNMDYVDLDRPYMQEVTLPISQVAFIFGALPYLKETRDKVYVSKGDQGRMAPAEFFQEAAPLLRDHFIKTKQFFPLANLYFASGEDVKGIKAVQAGVLDTMAIRDLRMLKHFCKLVIYSGAFEDGAIQDLYYNYICRIVPQSSDEPDIPNYARNIMEIKALLFSKAKTPLLSLSLSTNIQQGEQRKTGKLVDWIFSIAKRMYSFRPNDIELVLGYHSPLSVTVRANGDEQALAALLSAYLYLAGVDAGKMKELPVVSAYQASLPQRAGEGRESVEEALCGCSQEFRALSIHLSLLEYYVENFQTYFPDYETAYYFNASAVSGRAALPGLRG